MAISFDKQVPRWVTGWLAFMVLLVTAMIIVGGATRLTNSGLSITEWAPITGALPPLTQADWIAEFERYKLIPEFEAEHPDMDLQGFKFIYFWEWAHRQLGRIIGLVFALPLLILTLQRKLPAGRGVWLYGILILIGIQGAIGWWMVHSGLQEGMVAVSQYRLAIHLGMAFIILGLLLWMLIEAWRGWNRTVSAPRGWLPPLLLVLIYVQIMAGAFVAGTDSGKTYNSWPLMDGDVVPSGYWIQSPFWRNIFENPAAIQFNHRMLAYIILVLFFAVLFRYRRSRVMRLPLFMLGLCLIWQVGLGIWTLLAVAPLNLALLHQFSSIIVFIVAVWMLSRWKKIR
ncbi:COX15/CtaA family protein [Algimonas porphyrae]|uniref:Heme A synthase n=1 Tax=Algimonas porphyrae TaxID=1128113 RepID=A0ABQ5UXK0_9PROT|nr:COX15/CtaA family protein [Algimonas porphyrae]GLQ19124.1 heme A synthase [Algimonas porphyrae]